MKNDHVGVFGYTKLPARLRLARKCLFTLTVLLFICFLALWLTLDEIAQKISRAGGDGYTYGFVSGMIFTFTAMVGITAWLAAIKLYLGIGLSLGSDRKRLD